jgi:hypothetical protein
VNKQARFKAAPDFPSSQFFTIFFTTCAHFPRSLPLR